MTEPTDAELGQLAEESGIGWAAGLGGMDDFLRAFARAVLAKWGQPSQAAEPVAWRVHPFDYGIGQEGVYAMTMREEQREAWRRKGWNTEPLFAAPQPVAREPSAHIKEPYTLAEIKAKIASNDYSAEMLLQHAMLLLDSASLSANAGEPRNGIDEVIRLQTQAKQDEALIRQLVDALGVATTPLAKDRQEVLRAISAASARLDGKL